LDFQLQQPRLQPVKFVHKSIPYVVQPENIIPGVADFYATTVFDGFDFANVLVKTREGRPIKIENNTLPGAKFAANARVHASVLSLYDSMRLKQPKISGKAATWGEVDSKIKSSIADAKAQGGQVVLLTNTCEPIYRKANHRIYREEPKRETRGL
jgi:molybdopterin-containing oxidoreductase family iron-sulfur binding subunit